MNLQNIIQSVVDTWLPLLEVAGVIVLLLVIVHFFKRKND